HQRDHRVVEQAPVAALDAEHLGALRAPDERGRADRRVHAGGVAAAGQDPDSLGHRSTLTSPGPAIRVSPDGGCALLGGQRGGFGYAARTLVRIESDGPVTTVILDRKAVKNAVDRATAEALAHAFRAFEADPAARVAVLWGDHGTFSAGADLKAVAAAVSA